MQHADRTRCLVCVGIRHVGALCRCAEGKQEFLNAKTEMETPSSKTAVDVSRLW